MSLEQKRNMQFLILYCVRVKVEPRFETVSFATSLGRYGTYGIIVLGRHIEILLIIRTSCSHKLYVARERTTGFA
jgi:hypothetical protein